MTTGVVWRPQAADELLAAVAWYEDQQVGLGQQLATACGAAIELLRARPEMFATVHGPIRRVILRRFPYAIFYLSKRSRWWCLPSCMSAAILERGSGAADA